MRLFCPFCADGLDVKGDTFVCRRGEMDLTQVVAAGFIHGAEAPEEAANPRPLSFRVGGDWFCPWCAARMRESRGMISCTSCSRSLNNFVYQLIERHFHR